MPNPYGRTPLWYACQYGNLASVILFVLNIYVSKLYYFKMILFFEHKLLQYK